MTADNSKIMIALVGDQPVPNFLPVKELRPRAVVLLHTDLTRIITVTERLKEVIQPEPELKLVDGYNVPAIRQAIATMIAQNGWCGEDLIFNLTGGTKPMSFAALDVARKIGAEMVYLRSEGGHTVLDWYLVKDGEVVCNSQAVTAIVTLDEHLRMYLGDYTTEKLRNSFEKAVYAVLQQDARADEIFTSVRPEKAHALEIDFVIRRKSDILIAETKTKGAKAGIDQLNTAAEQRYLGTYVRRVLISGQPVDQNNRDLAKATKVRIIELNWDEAKGALSETDQKKLREQLWPSGS